VERSGTGVKRSRPSFPASVPLDGGSMSLSSVSRHLPDYQASHPQNTVLIRVTAVRISNVTSAYALRYKGVSETWR
jgi:hypothetical protein